MSGFHDIYVLAPDRSAKVAQSFLDAFVPDREQSAEEYLTSDGTNLHSADSVICHCVNHQHESQNIYFRNLSCGPAHAMLFFTSDGGLFLGLSVVDAERDYLEKLKRYAASEVGFIAFEEPPPDTVAEFCRFSETRSDR